MPSSLYFDWTGENSGARLVIAALRENTDRVVELHFPDGEIQTASIILVDDEGVVYDLIDTNREVPTPSKTAALWTTFDEIMAVLPSGKAHRSDRL